MQVCAYMSDWLLLFILFFLSSVLRIWLQNSIYRKLTTPVHDIDIKSATLWIQFVFANHLGLESISAERACRVEAGLEPFVQTNIVKPFLACLALESWEGCSWSRGWQRNKSCNPRCLQIACQCSVSTGRDHQRWIRSEIQRRDIINSCSNILNIWLWWQTHNYGLDKHTESSSSCQLQVGHSDVNEATTLRGRGRDPRGRGHDPRGQGQDPRGRGQVHEAAEVWKTEKFVMVH